MKNKILESIKKFILTVFGTIPELGKLLLLLFLIWCVLHGIEDFLGIEYHPRDD
jgi:hypothetical protein